MNIRLGVLGRLNLNHKINVWNVKSSGCDICCHQNLKLAFFEPFDGDFPLVLSDVTMHHFHILFDLIGKNQLVRILLRLSENDRFSISTVT